jgi:hypothetical protein
LEFIQHIIQDFSQRQLTNVTDRSVAFSGLESRISNAIATKSIYGILEMFLHQTLLWRRPEQGKLNRIDYGNKPVPSWSWMAYSGPIEFAISFKNEVACRSSLSIEGDERKTLSAAEVAKFKDCEVEEGTARILEKGTRRSIGRIWYDNIDDIPELNSQRYIVVGRDAHARGKYHVLVVSQVLKHEYVRIGIGKIERSFLLKTERKVHII